MCGGAGGGWVVVVEGCEESKCFVGSRAKPNCLLLWGGRWPTTRSQAVDIHSRISTVQRLFLTLQHSTVVLEDVVSDFCLDISARSWDSWYWGSCSAAVPPDVSDLFLSYVRLSETLQPMRTTWLGGLISLFWKYNCGSLSLTFAKVSLGVRQRKFFVPMVLSGQDLSYLTGYV